jgi:hypothetical protein
MRASAEKPGEVAGAKRGNYDFDGREEGKLQKSEMLKEMSDDWCVTRCK